MSAPPIDLRSDTVTRPAPAMRRAIAEAEVGDDVLDGDPTTRRLERRVAELLGQDDALFFPSGTQANQTGIALLTRPGTELLLEANAHLVHYEMAGVAANWGVQIRPISTPDGLLTGDLVRAALVRPRHTCRGPARSPWKTPTTPQAVGCFPRRDWRGSCGWQAMPGCGCTSTARGSGTPPWRSASLCPRSHAESAR